MVVFLSDLVASVSLFLSISSPLVFVVISFAALPLLFLMCCLLNLKEERSIGVEVGWE